MLDNVKVSVKLIGGFIFIALIGVAIGVVGTVNINNVNHNDNLLYETATVPLADLVIIHSSFQRSRINGYKAQVYAMAGEFETSNKSFDRAQEFKDRVFKTFKDYEKGISSTEEREQYGKVNKLFNDYCSLSNEQKDLLASKKIDEAVKLIFSTRFANVVDALNDELDKMTELNRVNGSKLSENNTKTAGAASKLMTTLIVIGFILSIILGVLMSGGITKPLSKCVDVMKALEDGDLTVKVDIDRKDEIGIMAASIKSFTNKINDVMRDIKGNAENLAGSSEELSTISSELVAASEEMNTQTNSVSATTEEVATNINTMASAAEEMSVNANSVATASEQMSTNVNSVSSAVEEMSSSIAEISRSSQKTQDVSKEAIGKSKVATETMDQLGQSAKEIGKVTDVIKRIAEQTNLLALNATIEAASAGEAGKGFAVVANEIKELANQSAQAAGDIAEKIEGVQLNTGEAVTAISDVSSVIDEIGKSVQTISIAVEQQTKASNDIANNVAEVSTGIKSIAKSITEVAHGANDVAKNSSEASKGAQDVAQNVSGVNQAAKLANKNAQQVSVASRDLAQMAASLQLMVEKFKI